MKRKLLVFLMSIGLMLSLCFGARAEGENVIEAETPEDIYAAILQPVRIVLTDDISIGTIDIGAPVTIDLNGHVLSHSGSALLTSSGNRLTITDSSPDTVHRFKPSADGLWVLDEDRGTETVRGGVITGGNAEYGGGVYIGDSGALTMTGGSIVGCRADTGGGVYVSDTGEFTMNSGSAIIGCTANGGGGVETSRGAPDNGVFTMNGGKIANCTATERQGGGVGNDGIFTMTGGTITGCTAPNDPASGGVKNGGSFIMTGGSIGSLNDAVGSSGVVNHGRYASDGMTISGDATTIYADVTNMGRLNADGGYIFGNVANGLPDGNPGTTAGSGSGVTTFWGFVTSSENGLAGSSIEKGRFATKVENGSGCTISGGNFTDTGKVINKGFISGGTFDGVVENSGGTISDGTFTGTSYVESFTGDVTGGEFLGTVKGELRAAFDPDNGEGESAQSFAWEKEGMPLTEPDEPVKSGHVLLGWYAGDKKWDFDGDRAKYTMTLTAQWDKKTYTVTYYADEYANEREHQTDTKTHGEPLTLKGAIFTRTGYTQTGRTTGQTDYALGGEYTNDTEVILLPRWTANRYTISFDTGGGSAVEPITQDCGTEIAPPAAPKKPGYTFAGWEPELPNAMPAEDLTVTAKWTTKSTSGPTYYPAAVSDTENGSVSVSPKSAKAGDAVTVTVAPDEGFVTDGVSVTDSVGRELEITELGGGRYRFTMPSGNVSVKASFAPERAEGLFRDVPENAYYYDAVEWASENGMAGGVGSGLFAPDDACTRAQIVTFLWRAAGSPVVNYAMTVTDVAPDAYYAEAVRWALSEGIATGTSDDKFSPDAKCTRAQAVTFLWRALGKPAGSGAAFIDVPADAYYASAVAWCVENGVTNGVGAGRFNPEGVCTRAQIVSLLFRAYRGG